MKLICAIVGVVSVTAAITYTISYHVAMNKFNKVVLDVNNRQAMYSKLSEVDQIIRENYYGNIDETVLKNGICKGYVEGISGNYTSYLTSEQYKKYLAEKSGKCVDIGVRTIQNEKNQMEVTAIYNSSPAETAGLKKGDIILGVNDRQVADIGYVTAKEELKGNVGTNGNVNILRAVKTENGEETTQELSLEISYQKYQKNTITCKIIKDSIGYIYIHDFTSKTISEFDNAVADLKNANCSRFIIDLRNTYSEETEYAVQVLNRVLPQGDIMNATYKNGNSEVLYTSDSSEFSYPLAILINDKTSNVPEVMASAVKDYNKGILVGQKTAGNGRMSAIYPLKDGSALKIWAADYSTPKIETFTNIGISPNIEIAMTDELQNLFNKENLSENDDTQLNAAAWELRVIN